MTSAKEDDLTMRWVVGERASQNGRRAVWRCEVRPSAPRDIVSCCQPAGEIDQSLPRRIVSDLVKDDVQVRSRSSLGFVRGTTQQRAFAAGGDGSIGPGDVRQGKLLAPGRLPFLGKMVGPSAYARIEHDHVIFGNLHQRMFLRECRVIVKGSPQEK